MAEVVGAELELEAVRGLSARRRHHARVVDQQVDLRMTLPHPLGKRPDRIEIREIEQLELELSARRPHLYGA